MRTSSPTAFRVLLSSSLAVASVALVVACGGGGGAPDAKNPGNPGDPASSSGASGGSTAAGSSGVAPGQESSTTTTQLGDGGNLSGAKLSSSSSSTSEVKMDGGAKPQAGSSEPGRRREDIQAIVLARREEARACYDKYSKDHPGMEGDLDVKFVIDPNGVVSEAEIDQQKSTIHQDDVGKCVSDVIKKIKFNKSDKGFETRAHYPFNFHPKQGAAGKDGGK